MFAQLFTEKTLLIAITIIGMIICTGGIGKVAARGEWMHPLSLVAYAIGLLILAIAGATAFDIQLPLIDSARTAVIVVVVLALAKVGLTPLHGVFINPKALR